MRLTAVAMGVGSALAVGCSGSASALTIGPADFGSNAVVQTFNSLSENYYGAYGPLALDGVTYATSMPGVYNVASGSDCVSGQCIGTFSSGAGFIITLDTPVMRVGGYVHGRSDQTPYVIFYDANYVALDGLAPTLVNEDAFFFGFQSAGNNIKYLQISPNAGQGIATLDNFTYEPLTAAAVPGPVVGAGLPGLAFVGVGVVAWFRRRKRKSIDWRAR